MSLLPIQFLGFVFCLISLGIQNFSFAQNIQTPSHSVAKIQGLAIEADELVRDSEHNQVILTGHVQIIFGKNHLSCRELHMDLQSHQVDARGNVILTTPTATIHGARILFDTESETGTIYDGYVQSGNVMFEGSYIEKIGNVDYLAEDGKYTTCTTCPESWSFRGKKIRAVLGGRAYLSNSFLLIGGIPVVWLPYIDVPLKTDRESGLLTPRFEHSPQDGITIEQGYFFAIDRHYDATLSFKNYEFRGPKMLINSRYYLTEQSGGEIDFSLMRDRLFGENGNLNGFRDPDSKNESVPRWFLKYNHRYELPDGSIQRMHLNMTSDLQYTKDFSEEVRHQEITDLGDAALENRVSWTKNSESIHRSVDASYYVNLLQANPLADNHNAVHRIPEIRYSQTQQRIRNSSFFYQYDFNYVQFMRNDFPYDDITISGKEAYPTNSCQSASFDGSKNCQILHDGKYDPETDLIRSGQRINFQTSVYRPLLIADTFEVLPKLTYRETQYFFNVGNDQQNTRRFLRAELLTSASMYHIYGGQEEKAERIKHEIQPFFNATDIPWIYHPAHPFFGQQSYVPFYSSESISDSDIASIYRIQFDDSDRIYDRRLFTFGFTNKFTRKYWNKDEPIYQQFLIWKISQSYNAAQAEKNQHPWSDVSSSLNIRLDRFETSTLANYFPEQNVTNVASRFRFKNEDGSFYQFEVSRTYQITPGQDIDQKSRTEDLGLSFLRNFHYADLALRLIYDANYENENQRRIKAWGYSARLKVPGDCWTVDLIHYQRLGSQQKFQMSVNFNWDGEKKSKLTENIFRFFGF